MMPLPPSKVPLFQVDAFTDRRFSGNPAAVCPLTEWLPDDLMQQIAAENNVSETAFFCPEEGGYRLRWFTPTVEVELCGHATLASGFVILTELAPSESEVTFKTVSGPLRVIRSGASFTVDLPARAPAPVPDDDRLAQALGTRILERHRASAELVVVEDAAAVGALRPDFGQLLKLGMDSVCVTAPAAPESGLDFVSRYFAPKKGVNEDPVTGAAHCMLAPYWSKRLNKKVLKARQLSARGGALTCEVSGARVLLTGGAVLVLSGLLHLGPVPAQA
jgi:PhzF family phenazine biosynthesis protein